MPYYEFRGHRQILLDRMDARERADQRGEKGLKAYWTEQNLASIDGLPGLATAPTAEKLPRCTDVMKKADSAEDGRIVVNGSAEDGRIVVNGSANGSAVAVKGLPNTVGGIRRTQELVVAFALGVAVAAVYARLAAGAA